MQNEVKAKNGGIAVETQHIFPVIKKWLYSEKEIFLREIVSNACDAVTKLKRLASLGQFEEDEWAYAIHVTLDKEEQLRKAVSGISVSAAGSNTSASLVQCSNAPAPMAVTPSDI